MNGWLAAAPLRALIFQLDGIGTAGNLKQKVKSKTKIGRLMKNAILCGMGMAMDLSGSAAFARTPAMPETEGIGYYFKKVGDYLQTAMQIEAPKVEREIALRNEQQLKLQLKV